jgi:2-dehydropantoate 2-reductase
MNKGEIYANAEWKSKLSTAMAEACAVAKASGAEVDAVQIQTIYDGLPSGIRSSMQKDLASGRPLELDAIGGPIVRGGGRYGIEVATAASLIAVISAKATRRTNTGCPAL